MKDSLRCRQIHSWWWLCDNHVVSSGYIYDSLNEQRVVYESKVLTHLRRVDFPAPRKPQMIVRGTRDWLTDSSTSESWSIKVLDKNEQNGPAGERPLERPTGCRRPNPSSLRLGWWYTGQRECDTEWRSTTTAQSWPRRSAFPFSWNLSLMATNCAPMTEEERRSVVQGPGDVEWRSVICLSSLYDQVINAMTFDWSRYEMRRECQEILPGLLLGPFSASKSLETLNSLDITHMWILWYSSDWSANQGIALRIACVYEMLKKLSPSVHGIRNVSSTWC